ncbi:MAG TPA: integrase [Pseudonocardiaceae bacterium]|nr:integrase [Pseudonocardiaceae bacterium]
MDTTTYDVSIWKTTVYKGKRKTTYYVRWKVGKNEFRESFNTQALADSYRSGLVTASRKGERFDKATGRPTSESREEKNVPWFEFAADYARFKWDDASPEHRRGISEALTNITSAMLRGERGKPADRLLRNACKVTFNVNLRQVERSAEVEAAVQWLSRSTRQVSDLGKPDVLRAVVKTINSRLDGTPAAASTARRKLMTLRNALDYAVVEKELLATNPLTEVKQAKKAKAPVLRQVDKRSVVNPVQARTLFTGVEAQGPSGERLVAFFGAMYYAGLRPEEAAALVKDHLSLPPADWNEETQQWEFADGEDGWGEIHLEKARPEVAAVWTDGLTASEERGLKHRDPSEGRTAPCPPELTIQFYTHIDKFGTAPDGRLFYGVRNYGRIGSTVYGRIWAAARAAVFTREIWASSLAKRPYDLRHAAVSTWLTAGVEATRVAEWAGHSVAVLLRVYAKFIDGGERSARARIQDALGG